MPFEHVRTDATFPATLSFASTKKFVDDENFPYGFQRSGEFTTSQAALLRDHGCAYKALYQGLQPPETDEEKAFVHCFGTGATPASVHEKTWARYLRGCESRNHYISMGMSPTNYSADDYPSDVD